MVQDTDRYIRQRVSKVQGPVCHIAYICTVYVHNNVHVHVIRYKATRAYTTAEKIEKRVKKRPKKVRVQTEFF